MKRILILFLSLLFFINGVNALEKDSNLQAYWELENLNDSSDNGLTFTNVGATYTATGCHKGGCYDFDGVSNRMYISSQPLGSGGDTTISMWVKQDTTIGDQDFCGAWGTQNLCLLRYVNGGTQGYFYIGRDGYYGDTSIVTHGLTTTNWNHILITYKSSSKTYKLYFNGVLFTTKNLTSTTPTTRNYFNIGAYAGGDGDGGVNFFNGKIDEVSLWNKTLNSTEVTDLYNNDITFVSTPTINDDIQSYYNVNNPTINVNTTTDTNMSYILDSGLETTICNNCNSSSFNLSSLAEGLHTLKLISTDSSGQVNTSKNFTIDTTDPSLNVTAFSEETDYIFNFSSIINYSDTNLDTCTIDIDTGDSIDCTNTSYTFNLNGNHTFNVSVNDSAGNTVTSNGNIVLINPYQYFYFEDSDSTPVTNFTINGQSYTNYYQEKIYDIGLGNITFTFSKLGYQTQNFTREMNLSSAYNETIVVPGAIININIYDRETRNLLSGLTTLTLVGPLGQNTSTTNGTASFQSLDFEVGDYQIIATHSNYATESAYFTFNNQEESIIDIYMLNSSATTYGQITITTKDEYSKFVGGAICKANEWNTNSSAFLPVAQGKTNGNGNTNLNIEIGTKLYLFNCEKSGITGQIPEEIVFADLDTRTIILRTSTTSTLQDFEYITASASEDVVGNFTTITYTFSNSLGTDLEACLNYYSTRGNSRNLLNTTCVTSSSGTIQEMIAINNTYNLLIEATIGINSKTYKVNSFIHKSINDISFSLAYYGLDKFVMPLAIILCIVLVFLTKFHFLGEFVGIIALWTGVSLVPSIWTVTLAMVGSVILSLMMYWGYKTK